MAQARA
ncbi:hypothetical protein HaLaN_31403, partial [Haematococcus lacustris]